MTEKRTGVVANDETLEKNQLKCGIIMPISGLDGYPETHWLEVKNIITQAANQIETLSFKTDIVSNSEGEVNIIHNNIISNIYNSDIVVCDISSRNPNVLFELGMRLTFDKPTVIIKDDNTPYIFDTNSIETLEYPYDLRFSKIVTFKQKLAEKIASTYKASQSDPTYSAFLGHFGKFKVKKLDQTEITEPEQVILEELEFIRKELRILSSERENQHVVKKNSLPNYKQNSLPSYKMKQLRSNIAAYFQISKDERSPMEILNSSEFEDHMFVNGLENFVKQVHPNLLPLIIEQEQTRVGINNF
ncbi:RNA helicase [Bacillus sp. FJAT-42376]|uniref:RNA helicase n=1 Tax=Bacillus sp. FJAT-42376 TaxID=2014076 RepID=UPI000F515385|nr:RNA helicase [Bacillus sp. FJAT-42376]AZB41790.1 RNA helicase [Bacillus sp. FJAT-42376]